MRWSSCAQNPSSSVGKSAVVGSSTRSGATRHVATPPAHDPLIRGGFARDESIADTSHGADQGVSPLTCERITGERYPGQSRLDQTLNQDTHPCPLRQVASLQGAI